MSTATPLTDPELTRYCALMAILRHGYDLTASQGSEFDMLHARAKIKVPRPGVPPPTITIPVTHPTDFICRDPAVDNS